jgi:hypothetical protein
MVTRATLIVAAVFVGSLGLMAQEKPAKTAAAKAEKAAGKAEKAEKTGGSETKIQKKDLPAAVQKAMESEIQGATVKGYAKEVEEGKTFYEVETTKSGHARDLLYSPDGTLAELEEEVAMDTLPAAVKTALEGVGKLRMVEKVTEGSKTFYEGHYAKGSKKSEVKVTADGKPVTK